MEIIVGLLIVTHVLVAWLAVRLFQYGSLYGRHWNYQVKTTDAPTQPSSVPKTASPSSVMPVAPIGDWSNPMVPEPDMTFRNDQINPFSEPAIGGKDAIPPHHEV